LIYDMYPHYWTTSNGGIFMRYSYEFKSKAVELYRKGLYPPAPDGISTKRFHKTVREWFLKEDKNGPEVLKHKKQKTWTPEEKLELVHKVLAGHSNNSVSIEAGISDGQLYQWVRKYKIFGYNGLVNMKKGRKPKEPDMRKLNINNPKKIEETEYEELVRLRAEIAYIKAENEIIKKEIALREEKEAARLKAKKQRSSKNSGKRDIS